jgi:hypothetical protein
MFQSIRIFTFDSMIEVGFFSFLFPFFFFFWDENDVEAHAYLRTPSYAPGSIVIISVTSCSSMTN